MRTYWFLNILVLMNTALMAQETIALPKTEDSEIVWKQEERLFHSKIWDTPVVTNVSQPSMEVFRADTASNTGAAVVVAPGGGMFALSIENEGTAVAKWLNKRGVTAFVLRYRLVPTGEDGTTEVMQTNPAIVITEAQKLLPYGITDALNAIAHIRSNATSYNIDPERIGLMGFSAGGAVTMGAGYTYTETNKPNFLVPIYPWTTALPVKEPQKDAPPMFIVCASDDPLGLASGAVALYSSMLEAQKTVSLMMYAKGGHGFGMASKGLPSDTWIERFYDWALNEKLIPSKNQ
ncbi:MAG: alpha/beta hydrolase [Bacteroidota bacterium]